MKQIAVVPAWSTRIWIQDDQVHVDLPMPEGPGRHRLVIPNNAQGLNQLLYLIRSRSAESKLGSAGDLTQHQLDKALIEEAVAKGKVRKAKAKPSFTSSQRITAREVLRKFGMI